MYEQKMVPVIEKVRKTQAKELLNGPLWGNMYVNDVDDVDKGSPSND